MLPLLLVTALLLPATTIAEEPSHGSAGTLCVQDEPCEPTNAKLAQVAPANRARTFLWKSGGRFVVGVIPVGATTVTLDASSLVRVHFSLAGADSSHPDSTLIIEGEGDRHWRIPLSRKQVQSGVDVGIAAGKYEIGAESPGHRKARENVIAADKPVDVALTLRRLPQITGRAISKRTGKPVPGATVSAQEKVLAISDGTGRFSFDADPDEWPKTIVIEAGGYGTVTMPCPRAQTDTDLVDIALGQGATVRGILKRPKEIGRVDLELSQRRHDGREGTTIASRTLDSAESSFRFDDIEGGEYLLLVRGQKPAQRFGETIKLSDGDDKQITISLVPSVLSIRAERDESPLAHAHIRLSNWDGVWHGEFEADDAGSVDVPIWQLGTIGAMVFDEKSMTVPYSEHRKFDDDGDAEWTIRVSTKEVRGRVSDAESGSPIPQAHVAIKNGTYNALIKTDDEGRFKFTAVTPGEHSLRAAADGYQPGGVDYTFYESEQTHEVDVRLQPGNSVRVSVRDAADRPIAGAAVLDFLGTVLTGQRYTDESGEVSIPLGSDQTRVVFVVPRDGSFAVAEISGNATATIRVPPAQSMIVISASSNDHEPIPNVWVVLRYNGVGIPFEVQQMLGRQQGAIPVSGGDGRIVLHHMPLGLYEFWPVGSPAEMRAQMMGLGDKAPVTVVAKPGLNEAVLTFAPANSSP